jgi:hypothetical protein
MPAKLTAKQRKRIEMHIKWVATGDYTDPVTADALRAALALIDEQNQKLRLVNRLATAALDHINVLTAMLTPPTQHPP